MTALRLKVHVLPDIYARHLRHLAPFVDEPFLRATLRSETHLASVGQHLQDLHGGRLDHTLQQLLWNVSVDFADNLPRR